MPIKMKYYSDDKSKIAPELKKLKNKSYPDFINALIDLCDDPKALNMIKQYFGGPKGENLLDAKKTILPASKLMPTQNEIDLDKSLKYGLTHPENIKNYFSKEVEIKTPIVTYNGSYIIDGHHRWSQIYIFNPKAKLVCINFEGELSPIQVLKSTQGSIAADISKVPVSKVDGTSMYDVDEDTIRKYITSYISDGSVEELKKYVKSVKSKDDAIEYLVNNSLHLIANNTPIAHAPKRDFMPQTDQASGALKKLDKSTTVFSYGTDAQWEHGLGQEMKRTSKKEVFEIDDDILSSAGFGRDFEVGRSELFDSASKYSNFYAIGGRGNHISVDTNAYLSVTWPAEKLKPNKFHNLDRANIRTKLLKYLRDLKTYYKRVNETDKVDKLDRIIKSLGN